MAKMSAQLELTTMSTQPERTTTVRDTTYDVLRRQRTDDDLRQRRVDRGDVPRELPRRLPPRPGSPGRVGDRWPTASPRRRGGWQSSTSTPARALGTLWEI
jgi:hypothetical protein